MVIAVAAFALVLTSAADSSHRLTGQLTQLRGASGCLSDFDTGGACAQGAGLQNPVAVTVAPDGKSVYVASFDANAISAFSRGVNGRLAQLPGKTGCFSPGGSGGCTPSPALEGASSVAVSPDGRNVYAAAFYANAVAAFSRTASGRLTRLPGTRACASEDGSDGACTDGSAHGSSLHFADSIALSPDGRNAYVGADQGVAVFARNSKTGALAQLGGPAGCIDAPTTDDDGNLVPVQGCTSGAALSGVLDIVVSPDGKNVYAVSPGFVAVLSRARSGALTQLPGSAGCLSTDGTEDAGGSCTTVPGLWGSTSITASQDGKDAYVAAPFASAVVVLARDPKSGRLTSLPGVGGCVSADGSDGSDGQCAQGRALDGVSAVAVSRDGKSVYATAASANAVLAFARGANGVLSQLPGAAGCVSDGGSGGACTNGKSLIGPQALAVSTDGRSLYANAAQLAGGHVTYDSLDTFRREIPSPTSPKCKHGQTSTKRHPCRK